LFQFKKYLPRLFNSSVGCLYFVENAAIVLDLVDFYNYYWIGGIIAFVLTLFIILCNVFAGNK